MQLFATPWTAARQAFLSLTVSWSLPKFMSIESVIPSNHLIFCCPLLLLPSVFPSIRVFSSESTVYIRWPTYWSCNFSIFPSTRLFTVDFLISCPLAFQVIQWVSNSGDVGLIPGSERFPGEGNGKPLQYS